MIWIVALGLGLLTLWLWRMRRLAAPKDQGDFAKWKRELADKERARRRTQPPSHLERQRHPEDPHY
jgi:hypothetical protein